MRAEIIRFPKLKRKRVQPSKPRRRVFYARCVGRMFTLVSGMPTCLIPRMETAEMCPCHLRRWSY